MRRHVGFKDNGCEVETPMNKLNSELDKHISNTCEDVNKSNIRLGNRMDLVGIETREVDRRR